MECLPTFQWLSSVHLWHSVRDAVENWKDQLPTLVVCVTRQIVTVAITLAGRVARSRENTLNEQTLAGIVGVRELLREIIGLAWVIALRHVMRDVFLAGAASSCP